jgi:hypothetical protein
MAEIARNAGFGPATVMLTKKATIEAVKDEIANAAKALKGGDVFLLTNSSHGGYVPDPSDPPVKPSGMSDTWCLYDGEIIDHELYNAWSQFAAGVRVLVFSDSCHSGTVVREYFVRSKPHTETDQPEGTSKFKLAALLDLDEPPGIKDGSQTISTVREIPPLVQEKVLKEHKTDYKKRILEAAKQRATNLVKCSVLLISGCQDDETSGDGPTNGVFTAAVKTVWANGDFPKDKNYHYFHRSILLELTGQQQHPNYYTTGVPNPKFEAQRPFTI